MALKLATLIGVNIISSMRANIKHYITKVACEIARNYESYILHLKPSIYIIVKIV